MSDPGHVEGAERPPTEVPRCPSCGYDLTGLRVEGLCPECGKQIWPRVYLRRPLFAADFAAVLGVISLICVLCLGPIACVPGALAVVLGLRARRHAAKGHLPDSSLPPAYFAIVTGGSGTVLGAIVGLVVVWQGP